MGLALTSGCLSLSGGCLTLGACDQHQPPSCCTSNGCCFDLANGRFRFHLYLKREYFASLDGTGTAVHTFIFEADIDLQIYGDCAYTPVLTIGDDVYGRGYNNNLDGTTILSNITCTWDGVDQPVPVGGPPVAGYLIEGINIAAVAAGPSSAWDGSTWSLYFLINVDGGVLDTYLPPLTPSIGAEDLWSLAGGPDGFPYYSTHSGNCAGIPLTVVTPLTWATVDNKYSVTTSVTIDMTVANNYCCKDGDGDCVPSDTPNAATDGACP